jgi:phosphate butyryltransferase
MKPIKSMDNIIKLACEFGPKVCVIAGSYKESEVQAALIAKNKGMIKPIFIGNKNIKGKFNSIDEDEIISESNHFDAAIKGVKLCSEGKADILLKGSIATSVFLKPVLNDEYGLKVAKLLSHIVILDLPDLDRLIAITDGGMCVSPNIDEKILILKNGVNFMHSIGIKEPRVGILSAIEVINNKIENTIEAAIIEKAVERGQISNCIVDGPLAFDLMFSEYACKVKGIKSDVCGKVDLIIVPDITAGNSVAKALIHFGKAKAAGAIIGTKKPVVMLSRADKVDIKLNSIALGVVLSETYKY